MGLREVVFERVVHFGRPEPTRLMKLNQLLVAIVSLGFVGVANAEDGEEKKPKGKGRGGPDALVKRMDTDGNGELSTAELSKLKEEQRARLLKRVDGNSDGKLDKKEIEEWKEKAAKSAGKKEGEGGGKKKKEGGETKEGE